MLSVPWAHPFSPLSCSGGGHAHSGNPQLPRTQTPFSTRASPFESSIIYGNRNPVRPRSRCNAKSARTEDAADSSTSSSIKSGGGGQPSSFLSILCPLLKFFAGGDPSQERNEFLEVATSSLSSLARLPWGSKSLVNNIYNLDSTRSQPQLRLYEFGPEGQPNSIWSSSSQKATEQQEAGSLSSLLFR